MKFLKIVFFLSLLSFYACSYLPENIDDSTLIIEENADYIVIKSGLVDDAKAGIVFYPGGVVDPHAYITSFKSMVVEHHRTVVIVKVTGNLAIWNSQKASKITDDIKTVDRWVIGGHSLGGSTACIDVFNNPDSFDGLFLLAAYSVNELADTDLPVISITGSNDEVLDVEALNENKVNLPPELSVTNAGELNFGGTSGTTIYFEIEGGNHAQFGNYGSQKGDGIADISPDEQQLIVTQMLEQFLLSNNL